MDIIRLKNMQFYGFHGVSESEKHLGGRFEVDLEMQLPLKKSCDSDNLNDTGDYENYDFGIGLNFAFPWAYIAVSNSMSFNDYKKEDTTVNSGKLRSDFTNTFDVMFTKAICDIFPAIDPNRSLFINLSLV